MAIVFHVGEDQDSQQAGLLENMHKATFAGTNRRIFTTSTILGLIVFFFFSLQCFSTVAVVRKETNSWRLAGTQLAFYTGLGYVLAVASEHPADGCGLLRCQRYQPSRGQNCARPAGYARPWAGRSGQSSEASGEVRWTATRSRARDATPNPEDLEAGD